MRTTMDMSSYEVEQDDMDAGFEIVQDEMEIEYSEEIMNTGWNPAVELVCEQLLQVPTNEQLAMAAELYTQETPADVSAVISEMLLRKMYSYQS